MLYYLLRCYFKSYKIIQCRWEFMEIFHVDFRIISEIQRAKFGILLANMFGGKIWGSGSDTNFRGRFCGQAPQTNHLIWKSYLGTWDTRPSGFWSQKHKSSTTVLQLCSHTTLRYTSLFSPCHFSRSHPWSMHMVISYLSNYWSSSSQAVPFRDWESSCTDMNKTTKITAARIILYQCMSCGTSPEIVRRKRGDKFTN